MKHRRKPKFRWWEKAKISQQRREEEALQPRHDAKQKLERLKMIKAISEKDYRDL